MTSPPLDDIPPSADSRQCRAESPRRLLAETSDPTAGLYIRVSTKRRRMARTARKNRREILLGGLIGTAAVALLIYGATHAGTTGQNSVTTRVPDAESAGAAVQSLPPPNLLKPVTAEEAINENADRPFAARADTPPSRFILKASGDDRERALTCLTQAVYYEAASEGVDGQRAVAQVVLNRMRHPGYPSTVCGVVYQGSDRPTGCQFTFTCDGSLLRPHVESLWNRSRKIAEEALAGHVFAPVGHATSYHADYVLPYWADSLDKSVQIGRHIFYRLKGAYGDKQSFFQRYAGFEPPIPDPRPAVLAIPGATAAEEQQLAKTLIDDETTRKANEGEKVAIATSPLLADAKQSALIIDQQSPTATAPRKKAAAPCNADERSRLTPLSATDMRAGSDAPTC